MSIETLKENGFNLDIKNPFVKEEETAHTTAELLQMLDDSFRKSGELLAELKNELE